MTDRERLLEILSVPIHPRTDVDPLEAVADYLLDNGVSFANDTNVHSWIPVSERLPEKWKAVLVCRDFEYSDCVSIEWRTSTEEWSNDNAHNPKVTHWMPLPEPPKEDTVKP